MSPIDGHFYSTKEKVMLSNLLINNSEVLATETDKRQTD